MSAEYELWQTEDGACLFPVPCPERPLTLHEAGARLVLRFRALTWEDAKALKDRFLYDDNPDRLAPLNIPASHFFFADYHCGIHAGEIVRLKIDYHCVIDGHYCGFVEADTRFLVVAGDIDAPTEVWMRVVDSPSGRQTIGQYHHLPDNEHFSVYFERVHSPGD